MTARLHSDLPECRRLLARAVLPARSSDELPGEQAWWLQQCSAAAKETVKVLQESPRECRDYYMLRIESRACKLTDR